MGAKRIPLDMQKGNLTVEQQNNKQQSEEAIIVGRDQLSRPPNWLTNKLAKSEFIRLVKEYETINVVGNLDLNNIACYCNAYASYRKATEELEAKGQSLVVEKTLPNGAKTLARNPLIDIQRIYADEMRKFASLCGLTIDSRLKVGTVQTTKANLDIGKEFGDI